MPSTFEAAEAGGDRNLVGVVVVTGIWLIPGLIAALLTLRWVRKDS